MKQSKLREIPIYHPTRKDIRFFLSIMLPALVELVLSQVFSMVDTMMLGNVPDSAILVAAVGMTSSAINLTVCVITAFCIGTTAAIAWYTGAGDHDAARSAVRQSLFMMAVVGLIVTAAAVLFAYPIIGFAGAGEDTIDFAVTYYRYIAAGFFFQAITISITASLRGIGVTKIPMLYNLAAAVINVCLNYVLIYGKFGFPMMGITGAALATTLSKLIAFGIAVFMILFADLPICVRCGTRFRPNFVIIQRILRVGIPSCLEQVILQSGAVLSTKIVSVVPTTDFAANQIAASIEGLAWQPGSACNAASTTCMGQSLGEGRVDKARAMTRMIVCTSLLCSFCMVLLFLCFGESIAGLYIKDQAIAHTAGILIACSAFGLPGVGTHLSVAGALRGAGDTKTPLLASLCSLWIFRVGLGFLLIRVLGFGVYAARMCIALDQLVRAAIVSVRYLRGNWADKVNTTVQKDN